MHRTWGEGYVEEPFPGQYHRFVDQNLPSVPGTVDTAEYNNAVQEEICNCIEMNGGTLNGGGLNGNPAADRTAGWHQLYDTIFEGGNLTDLAVDGFTFAKLSGTINLTVGGDTWTQSAASLLYSDTSSNQNYMTPERTTISRGAPNQVELTPDDTTWTNNLEMQMTGRGIRYKEGPGDSGFRNGYYRKARYSLTSIPWAAFLDTNGDNTGVYVSYQDYVTDIPDTVPAEAFISAWIQYLDGSNMRIAPATVVFKTSGGFVVVEEMAICVAKNSSSPNPTANLFLEFDASTLS